MNTSRVSRRRALTFGAASMTAVALPGCGGGPTTPMMAARIVVAVVQRLDRVLSVVVRVARLAVEIVALIQGVVRTFMVRPEPAAFDALAKGGVLLIRDADGREFACPYTIE